MKKQSVFTPVIIGGALLVLLVLMAKTELFQPLVQFIHTGEITFLQAFWCFLATAAAFGLILKLLVMLGGYFLPEAERRRKEREEQQS